MLEVRQGLLEEGHQAGLGRGVKLFLKFGREQLWLNPTLNEALYKLSHILGHGLWLVTGQSQQCCQEVATFHFGSVWGHLLSHSSCHC